MEILSETLQLIPNYSNIGLHNDLDQSYKSYINTINSISDFSNVSLELDNYLPVLRLYNYSVVCKLNNFVVGTIDKINAPIVSFLLQLKDEITFKLQLSKYETDLFLKIIVECDNDDLCVSLRRLKLVKNYGNHS